MTLILAGTVVGSIIKLSDGRYRVNTKGHVPEIDGFTGSSFSDLLAKVENRVRSGGVNARRPITGVKDAHRI